MLDLSKVTFSTAPDYEAGHGLYGCGDLTISITFHVNSLEEVPAKEIRKLVATRIWDYTYGELIPLVNELAEIAFSVSDYDKLGRAVSLHDRLRDLLKCKV